MEITTTASYGAWSLLPAILAIGVALLSRQVLPSLFLGVWAGGWLLAGGDVAALWTGLLSVVDTFLLHALAPPDGSSDHMAIILFTLLTGGMIGIVSKNGGMQGIVSIIACRANTVRKGQLAAALTGLAVFFDDYANTLIVGNTMRPLTDRLKISREKLAYLVDSTAAPIATVALMTTWIGYQVSLIDGTIADIPALNERFSGYELMLHAIAYSFYPLLCIAFLLMVVLTGRDFGPMLKAERTARASGSSTAITEEATPNDITIRAGNALIPIGVLIVSVVIGILWTGGKIELGDSGLHWSDDFLRAIKPGFVDE